jgi:hypothetical protein
VPNVCGTREELAAVPGALVRRVASANADETVALLQELRPRVVVVNGTRILSKRVLGCIDAVFINMHAGITPLYRGVHVTGIPLPSVEARLREFLGTLEENPQFVVEPLLRVAVAGEVRQPTTYNLRPETSLSEAVAIAGVPGAGDDVTAFSLFGTTARWWICAARTSLARACSSVRATKLLSNSSAPRGT